MQCPQGGGEAHRAVAAVGQVEGQGQGGHQLAVLGQVGFQGPVQTPRAQLGLKAGAPFGEGLQGLRVEAQEGRGVAFLCGPRARGSRASRSLSTWKAASLASLF